MSAIEQWGGHLPVGRRAAALGPIREAIAALSDQAIALHEAGDHEALAAGGQDLETVVDELSTLHRDVRLFVADLIDKRERVLRAADAEKREAGHQHGLEATTVAETAGDQHAGRQGREIGDHHRLHLCEGG